MDVRFSSRNLDTDADLLAFGVGSDVASDIAALDARFDGHLARWIQERSFDGSAGATLSVPTLGRLSASEVVIVGVGERTASDLRTAAGQAARAARALGAGSLFLDLGDTTGLDTSRLVEAVQAGNYVYDAHKPEADRKAPLATLTLATPEADVTSGLVRAKWQQWARDLVNMPAEDLYPESLAQAARDRLGALSGVTVEVWDDAALEANNCVGVLAVGRASSRRPRLIKLAYRPSDAKAHVALVGKGVTFDAGGLSLKPSGGMQTMRCDMGGAATVLAAFGAAAELGLPVAIDCFVGAAENMVSANSFKLGDILHYDNGVTVEIHNTDAEGRLVMADCLIQASRIDGVTHIVDAATLTGACVVALGPDFTGLFTGDDAFAADLDAAALADGEGLWRLPLHQPYKRMLKADWGQIKNVGGRDAGSTTAALFLQHFVGEGKRWAHLDIAGSAFQDKSVGFYTPGATGEMVRPLTTWMAGLAD